MLSELLGDVGWGSSSGISILQLIGIYSAARFKGAASAFLVAKSQERRVVLARSGLPRLCVFFAKERTATNRH